MGLLNTIITVLVAFGSAIDAIDSADVGLTANLILAETVIASSDVFQIECLNGSEVLNGVITERTCHEACAGSCCEEDNACDLFTGSVRTDGSCSGVNACSGAKIGLVENSCIGDYSCSYAGVGVSDVGIGSIKSSCNGHGACSNAAYEGYIDSIEESCNYGDYNCYQLARGGSIGRILSSCSGTANAPVNDACAEVGVGEREVIYDILSCCNSDNGEGEVCCQSSNYCDNTITTLPEDCAAIASPPPSPSMDYLGFARHFADE